MQQIAIAAVVFLALGGNAFGNVGVFFGSGHTLCLAKSADVQMVSEDVTIRPACGPTVTTHRVEFYCKFVLKNLSKKQIDIQVGFPLDRQGDIDEENEMDLVLSKHFIARDQKNTYHVRHTAGNKQNSYGQIFLWDMRFASGETKTLYVSYILPMSYTMGDTDKRIVSDLHSELFPDAVQDNTNVRSSSDATRSTPDENKGAGDEAAAVANLWRIGTTVCAVVGFSYITETGKSWAGPIEKATFRVDTTGFEHCLRRCPIYAYGDLPPGAAIPGEGRSLVEEMDAAIFGYDTGLKLGTVYREISPKGWKPKYFPDVPPGAPTPKYEPDGIVWQFDNYKPGTPLEFRYFLLGFPEKPNDCDPWVRMILGETPTKSELLDLREILAAFYGIAPRNASIRSFVEQQVWFNPESKTTEAMLTKPRQAVLARLDALANKAP